MKQLLKHRLKLLIFIILSTWPLASQAIDPTFTTLFSDQAIRGYDTVAYFTEGKPVKGDEQYTTTYNQAMWLFSSQENLDLFLTEPEKYVPQYGGYCAYAVSQNTTASIKPKLFTIYQGKLYLNYSKGVNQTWRADKDNLIQQADKNWPRLLAD